jgi:hypothetical protein
MSTDLAIARRVLDAVLDELAAIERVVPLEQLPDPVRAVLEQEVGRARTSTTSARASRGARRTVRETLRARDRSVPAGARRIEGLPSWRVARRHDRGARGVTPSQPGVIGQLGAERRVARAGHSRSVLPCSSGMVERLWSYGPCIRRATMERVDEAFTAFKKLRLELPANDKKVITESDTRFKLIDPMLTTVLGWPKTEILTEEKVGEGRLDYLLSDAEGRACAVVEAKQRDIALVTEDKRGQLYRIDGPVFQLCQEIFAKQLVPYCQSKRVAVGFLTNGVQWVGVLGNRVDGVAFKDDRGAAFSSLDDIAAAFELFYNLFSFEGFRRGVLVRQVTGSDQLGEIRSSDAKRVVNPGTISRMKRSDAASAQYYSDISAVLDSVFRSIDDDPQLLEECFVDSRESADADQRLVRVTEDLIQSITQVRTDDDFRAHVVERVDSLRPPPRTPGAANVVEQPPSSVLVQLLGERSAGKTTFLRRFYHRKLDRKAREHVLYVHLRLDTGADLTTAKIGERLANELENELFGPDGPDNDQLLELYKTEWKRYRKPLPETIDEAQERTTFTREMQKRMSREPFEHAVRLGRFAIANRRRLPCIVLDDFDNCSTDQVREIYRAAVTFATECPPCVVTLALDDTTVWRTREVDTLARLSPISFWLPRPMVREVLANRFEYIRRHLGSPGDGGIGRLQARVGKAGMRWNADPDTVVRALQSAFIWDEQDVVNWVGALANHDVREVLNISKDLLRSPHIRIENHLGAVVADTPPTKGRIVRALISPEYECYHPDKASRFFNVFTFARRDRFAVLLPLRILAILRATAELDAAARHEIRGFAEVAGLLSYFEQLGVPSDATRDAIQRMLSAALVQAYNPSLLEFAGDDPRIKITPRGQLHLEWAVHEIVYVRMMGETDHILDADVWRRLSAARDQQVRASANDDRTTLRQQSKLFVTTYLRYLLARAPTPSGETFEAKAITVFEEKLRSTWLRPALSSVSA